MKKNLTVVVGAGASTGSVQPGATSQRPIIPPITKDLFSPRFESWLTKFRDVQTAMGAISSEVEDGKSLEDYIKGKMGTITQYNSLDPRRKRQLHQLPLYLQDLFSAISKQLESANHYHRFVNDLFDADLKLTFISLNYDLLLDNAIERAKNNKFTGFGNYTDKKNEWVLIKPHGSVNWFRQIINFNQSGNNFESWKAIARNINLLKDLSSDFVFLDLDKQFKEGFKGFVPYYPALALPNTEYKPIYPLEEHELLLKRRLEECENFLIIGFSAYDQDILNILKTHVKKVNKLLIVGKDGTHDIYKRLSEVVPKFSTATPKEVIYDLGFEGLIKNSKVIDNFLSLLSKA